MVCFKGTIFWDWPRDRYASMLGTVMCGMCSKMNTVKCCYFSKFVRDCTNMALRTIMSGQFHVALRHIFFFMAHPMGHGLLINEASRSYSGTPHSVGLLWTSDRPVAQTTRNTHNRRHPCPHMGFELAVPASERPQTQTLDRAVHRHRLNLYIKVRVKAKFTL